MSSATGYSIMATDPDMSQYMSNRFRMWQDFAREVGDHIETYTIPQYGDYPDDQLSTWTLEDFATTIKRYSNRMGKNVRGLEEDKRDMLKISHYASCAWHKLNDTEKNYVKELK